MKMATTCTIPIIDLHDFPNQSSKLMAACEEWGCFRLLNHHEILPSTLMYDMKSVVKSLFDLPIEIKRQNLDLTTGSGYMAPTAERPLYEALGMYGMDFRHDVETFCSQLDVSSYQRYSLSLSLSLSPPLCLCISRPPKSVNSLIFQYEMG